MAKGPPLQIFSHGGGVLHWRKYGSGSPIVLVHGLSGSRHWWARNLPALKRRHSVYIIELTGFGSAWRHRALGISKEADLIAAWLEAEGLLGAVLLGHSMGGQIVTMVAAKHPQRLRGLVLANASGLLEPHLIRSALQLPKAALTGRVSFIPRVLFDSLRAGPLNVLRSTADLLGNSTADLLQGIDLPTLVIWGDRDALVPVELGRRLADELPSARFVSVPHAGHVVMVDAPEEFNREVLHFTDSLGPQYPQKV